MYLIQTVFTNLVFLKKKKISKYLKDTKKQTKQCLVKQSKKNKKQKNTPKKPHTYTVTFIYIYKIDMRATNILLQVNNYKIQKQNSVIKYLQKC